MIATPPPSSVAPRPHPRQFTRWGSWLGILLVAGHLIFCHGCHGDEDNELSAPPHLPDPEMKQPAEK